MTSDSSGLTQETIEGELARRGSSIRNKAAFGALVAIIPVVGEGLNRSLTAGDEAIAAERLKLPMDLVIELLSRIDQAISDVGELATSRGATMVEVGGTIRVEVANAETAIGMQIQDGAPSVTFQQGTVIDVKATNVDTAAGLVIGSMPPGAKRGVS